MTGGKSVVEGSISRVLFFAAVTVRQVVIIHLGRALPRASSDVTRKLGRATLERFPISSCSGWGLPCDSCHHEPGELLPRRFTLAVRILAEERGGLFSVALSSGSPPLAVSEHPAHWSPDFPPACARHASDHPDRFDGAQLGAAKARSQVNEI